MARGCRCTVLWCDLDLTFYLAAVTLTINILETVRTLVGGQGRGRDMHCNGVILI